MPIKIAYQTECLLLPAYSFCIYYMRLILISGWFIISFAGFAQHSPLYFLSKPSSVKSFREMSRSERYLSLLEEDTPIEGSMYLEDDFAPGIVILDNQQIISDCFFRYNVFRDEMEFINPAGDTLILMIPSKIKEIIIGSRVFIFSEYTYKKELRSGYLEVLCKGDFTLLKKYRVIFEPANPPYTALHMGHKLDRFVKLEFLYLQSGSSPARKIKPALRFLMETLPSKKAFILEYSQGKQLNLRRTEDLIDLFRALNFS